MVAPAAALRKFIKTYWVLSSCDGLQHVQHIVPNGCAGIIFYRKGEVSMSVAGKANAALAGATMQPIEIQRKGFAEMIGVQFSEFGLRALLGFPATAVFQDVVKFDQIGDKDLMELEEKIMTASGVAQCFALLDDFFLRKLILSDFDSINFRRINAVLHKMRCVSAPFTMNDFASAACLSPKQLSRVFNEYVGISPKDLSRILRCNNAISKIRQSMKLRQTLTEISCECGYYDLPHMNTEFRSICGASPTSILLSTQKERGNYSWGLERE